MDKRMIIGLVMIIVVIVAAISYIFATKPAEEPPLNGGKTPTNVEYIGGKYNANITFYEDFAEIEYKDEEGIHSDMYFALGARDALDWIKLNTAEVSMFLCWWDYGHMIKGYAERDVVIRNPSEEIVDTVANPSEVKEFDSHEQILDVAIVLTTSNSSEMMQILEKYGVTHILIPSRDINIAWIYYSVAGRDWNEYLMSQDSGFKFTELGKQTLISRLLENRDLSFGLMYEDSEIKIYEVK